MFKLDHHNKILTILKAMNAPFLEEIGAFFGGGTLLTLSHGEYRWSKDIDFICPVSDGYRELRKAINQKGFHALFSNAEGLAFPRDLKADQYGVRFGVKLQNIVVKVEVVAEARITLGPPEFHQWCKVPCLNFDDACSEKLLSNADRWADASVESRDLIDLAVLRNAKKIPVNAIEKAEAAYPVIEPLHKAIRKFQKDDDYRDRCFKSLEIKSPESVNKGIKHLLEDISNQN